VADCGIQCHPVEPGTLFRVSFKSIESFPKLQNNLLVQVLLTVPVFCIHRSYFEDRSFVFAYELSKLRGFTHFLSFDLLVEDASKKSHLKAKKYVFQKRMDFKYLIISWLLAE
jgi:hypothetical protein